MTSAELGEDWERTEVLHKKFEEFQADLETQKRKLDVMNQYANPCAEVRWGAEGQCREGLLIAKAFRHQQVGREGPGHREKTRLRVLVVTGPGQLPLLSGSIPCQSVQIEA